MSSSSPWCSSSALLLEGIMALYVLSGVCQPLLMTVCKQAGLADPTAQLYMVFYYLGPGLLIVKAWKSPWPSSPRTCRIAVLIAVGDVFAQALNYTGTALCGPTLFAIIYSSVTVWTAVWARCVLCRFLNPWQWCAVALVFGGLALTASDSVLSQDTLGPHVVRGTFLVVIGSALHAGSYVWSEYILLGKDTTSSADADHAHETLTVEQNTGLQCWTAAALLGLWQLVYTVPRWDRVLAEPLADAGTSWRTAWLVLVSFGVTNLVHAYTFFYTIKHYKGGSVTAGILKGLQAVLVFGATHLVFCGRVGGPEMCISRSKLVSLVTVLSGVVLFSWATPHKNTATTTTTSSSSSSNDAAARLLPTTSGEQDALLLSNKTRPNSDKEYKTLSI